MNVKTGIRYGMDEVGTRIWSQLKANRSVREIRDFIVEEYSVESSRCERDLLGLLTELAQHELVEFTHAADRAI
ncbi:MAG TPA: PqqD family protein [Verrucomicrobiae bacterium]